MASTVYVEDMSVGMSRSRERLISEAEIALFGEVSGDRNPVHFDEAYAAGTMFGGVIAHGMLAGAMISAVLGEDLPGHGTVYLGQTLKFRGPVRPGDVVRSTVTVAEINLAKRRVTLDCVSVVGDQVVVEGQATVLAPSRAGTEKVARAA